MADSSASGPQSLTVFMHSNLPQIEDNFTLAGASSSRDGRRRRTRPSCGGWVHAGTTPHGCVAEARLGLEILKYEWLASAAAERPQPWLLTDTDVIVQCKAAELARAGLVWRAAGGQRRALAFPQPEPYGTLPNELIRARGRARRPPPCATPTGRSHGDARRAARLRAGAAARLPVPRWWPSSVGECRVDDQGCLHAALQRPAASTTSSMSPASSSSRCSCSSRTRRG